MAPLTSRMWSAITKKNVRRHVQPTFMTEEENLNSLAINPISHGRFLFVFYLSAQVFWPLF
jgi:hypothetical protein